MWYNIDTATKTKTPESNTYTCKILQIYSCDLEKLVKYATDIGQNEKDISHNKFGEIDVKETSSYFGNIQDEYIEENKDMYYGYFTKAKLIRIIYEDRVVLRIHVNLKALRNLGNIISSYCSEDCGYTTNVTCKLMGVERKDKIILQLMAKEYLEQFYDDYVYVLFSEQENHGTYYVQLFKDQDRKESINSALYKI